MHLNILLFAMLIVHTGSSLILRRTNLENSCRRKRKSCDRSVSQLHHLRFKVLWYSLFLLLKPILITMVFVFLYVCALQYPVWSTSNVWGVSAVPLQMLYFSLHCVILQMQYSLHYWSLLVLFAFPEVGSQFSLVSIVLHLCGHTVHTECHM